MDRVILGTLSCLSTSVVFQIANAFEQSAACLVSTVSEQA